MSKAPYPRLSRVNAFSLFSFYSAIAALPTALLVWAASAGMVTERAIAQTSQTESSNSEELLEQARQRLLDQGEAVESSPVPNQEAPDSQAIPLRSNPQFDAYRLGPGDSLFVNVLYFPELNFQPTLDLQGNVILPLVGALSLRGLTLEQARQRIQAALNRYVIDPEVDVTLVTQRPVQVTVIGEVVKPGVYPLSAPQLNVALISAGGTTQFADLRTVRIRRTLTNGSVIERDVDLFTPLRDSASIPDVRLQDGDAIVVPGLTPENLADYDRTLIARSTIAQPQIVVRVLNYSAGTGGRDVGNGAIRNITLPNGSTFLDAVTVIGPSPDRADLGDVAVIRFDPVQGRAVAREFHAKDALLGDASQNPPLEHNDVVVIGRNLISRITYALNTFTQPFRDILGFFLFFDTLTESAEDVFGPGGDDNDDDDDNNN